MRQWMGVLQKEWIYAGLAAAFALFLMQALGFFNLADSYWQKGYFEVRNFLQLERTKGTPIVLVTINPSSAQKFGEWPWKRETWGELTSKLEQSGASVIAYDSDFSSLEPGDDTFALSLSHNVLLPTWFDYMEKGKVSVNTPPIRADFPSPPLFQRTRTGFINVQEDYLGVEKSLLYARYNGRVYPSFALEAFLMYEGYSPGTLTYAGRRVRIGQLSIPLDGNGLFWLNYQNPNFEEVPAEALLDPKFPGNDVFRDKIVLIGVTSPAGQDKLATPLGPMSDVEIQGEILRNLIQRRFIVPMNPWLEFLFLLVLGAVAGAFLPLYPWKRFLPWVGIAVGLLVLCGFLLFLVVGVMQDIFAPTLLLAGLSITMALNQSYKTEAALSSKNDEIKMINEVNWLNTGNLSLGDFLSSALDMVQEVMRVNNLGVLTREEDGRLILSAAKGFPVDQADRVLNGTEGICGRAASSGKAILVQDIPSNPYAAKFEKTLKAASFLAVPLLAKGEILGVLWVASEQGSFDRDAQIRLIMVANQLAVGVSNCNLSRKLSQLYLDAVRSLLRAVEYYHPSVKGHSERVASYSLMLAKACELPAEEIETIRSAALLHDIGRMGHYEAMTRKPEGLTEVDWKQILTPLKLGLKILEPLSSQFPILPILYHFYERYDGKGFPDKLQGEKIPIGSRILAIANAFDDVSTNGPQLGEVSLERAIQELKKEAGTLFDPNLVRLFVNLVSHLPAEEIVRGMKRAV